MAQDNLKQKTKKGLYWSAAGNFANQGMRFVFGLILARLLSPDAYGVIGMLGVFMCVVSVFIDCGFSQALIAKQDRTQTDFSTEFFFNIGVGIVGYTMLIVAAPFKADFYNMGFLKNISDYIEDPNPTLTNEPLIYLYNSHQLENYSNESLDIISHTNGTRHNTITPIARKHGDMYELDLVLRNNRTNETYPDGIFHPHQENHHIKKENIGLIEVMGLAILPARLKTEMNDLKACLLGQTHFDEVESLAKHKEWFETLKQLDINDDNVQEVIEKEITKKFVAVLENAGVYKMDEAGIAGFTRFVESLSE